MKQPKTETEILAKFKIDQLNEMQLKTRDAISSFSDVILLSPTGTGKTLAFLLPIIDQLDPTVSGVQVMIVVPSRELAIQIEQVVREMGTGYKVNAMYGGQPGARDKAEFVHPPAILIGTPGRIAAHVDRQIFDVNTVKLLVLDEFDKSLEIGFDDEMIIILEDLVGVEQKILTSATFGVDVPDFVKLTDPVTVDFLKSKETETSTLSLKGISTKNKERLNVLVDALGSFGEKNGILFCNYKDSIHELSQYLTEHNIEHGCFHGGMEQKDRERALIQFRNGTHRLLIATDLAARGIDIPDLDYIIHYQLPHKEEEFIHRNGRTARMQKTGTAYVLINDQKELPDFIPTVPIEEIATQKEWKPSLWKTLFVSGGRKDKISKGDLAGLFFKQAQLDKEQLGIIELKQNCAFVAVHKSVAQKAIKATNNVRLKKKKVRISLI